MSKHSKPKKNQQSFPKIAIILVFVVLIFAAIYIFQNQNTDQTATLPLDVSAQQAYNYRENGAFVLDVRTQEEWDAGHIPGATLIPLDQLPDRLSEVPQNTDIVVVCHSGNRSKQGRDILLNAGFTNVTSMTGGVIAWEDAGYPFTTP